jgi:hypothetical protein
MVTSNARVLADGAPVLTMSDAGLIAGCSLLAGDRPNPCVSVRWMGIAARVLISGQPAVKQAAAGICLTSAQTPAGPVIVVAGQSRIMVV